MTIQQQQIERAVALARTYGATRLILFGSALENPDQARDLDLACEGVLGWKLELGARLEQELRTSVDFGAARSTDTVYTLDRNARQATIMTASHLREEIAIELALMESTVNELLTLKNDLAGREPTVREKTAAGAFLAQFYSGVENILKRISRYYNVPLPVSETWHIALFESYCFPPQTPLPGLFDDALAAQLAPYRNFRHVIYHSYGFELDWKRMAEGVAQVPAVFQSFRGVVTKFLQNLE